MTDDQTLLDLAGRATPRPWHHVNAFQTVPASNTVHGRVPAERVDYVSTWPDLGTPPGHRVVIQQPDRECRVRSEDMAYITAACNEVPRLVEEKRSEASRADLTGFMLAWVVAEYEQMKAHLRQSLHDQSAALADPEMPILTQAVREQLRDEAEASYAMADNEAERVYAHGLSLLCDWQDRAAEAKASKPLRIPVELDEAKLPGAPQ